jgi:hypothetical protein
VRRTTPAPTTLQHGSIIMSRDTVTLLLALCIICCSTSAGAGVSLGAARRAMQHQQQTKAQQLPQEQPQQHVLPPLDDPQLAEALAFLQAHMPARDRALLSTARLTRHARLALAARRATAWAAAVPWPLFLNDVLPHRNLDEPADAQDWRPLLFERCLPLVANAGSLAEAAQILNRCARLCVCVGVWVWCGVVWCGVVWKWWCLCCGRAACRLR